MAQNLTIAGASYSDVPALVCPKTGGGTARFSDASETTAVEADVTSGKRFLGADGEYKTGSASGGGSEWEFVISKEISASTAKTSATDIEWWDTGKTSIWTSAKAVYIRIRDKAGKRNGYFYGSDTFFVNQYPITGAAASTNYIMRTIYRVSSSGLYNIYATGGSTGYGVYVSSVEDTGSIRLMSRYNSTYSLTIDGTYTVEVYLLSPPTGKPFFE